MNARHFGIVRLFSPTGTGRVGAAVADIGLATLLAIAVGACGDPLDDLPWQAQAAADMRELELLGPVELIEMSRAEFAEQAEQQAEEISDESLQRYAETYGRLGYFDVDLDLRPIVAESSSDWVGAQYSPTEKLVTLVGAVEDDIVVHEFVHALQDQHFDIQSYELGDTSDGFLARRAVVEGDATLAQYRFIMRDEFDVDLDEVGWAELIDDWRAYTLSFITDATYPPIFLDYVSFTYAYGMEYCALNLLGVSRSQPDNPASAPHDWQLQNDLYQSARAPRTTRAILELDLETASAPAPAIGLTAVPPELDGRLTTIDWDSMGEWSTYLLLLPLEVAGELADARLLASRWVSDRALFVEDDATSRVGAIWTILADDEAAASALVSALYAVHGSEVPADGFESVTADGELLWLEQRGATLVVIRNVAADLAPTLAASAFAGQTAAVQRRRLPLTELIRRMRPHTAHALGRVTPAGSGAGNRK